MEKLYEVCNYNKKETCISKLESYLKCSISPLRDMTNFSRSHSWSWCKATSVHSRAYRNERSHPRFPRFYFAIRFCATGHCYPADRLCMAACRAEAYWRRLPIQAVESIPLCLGHRERTRSCQAPITDNQFHRHLRTALIRAVDALFRGTSSRVRPGNTLAWVKQ